MRGSTVVITGATSGIGEFAAGRLAAMGARIVFVARDKTRGEATLKHLRAIAPDAGHTVHYADLSRLTDMKRVASEIAAAETTIDVLINNAGAIFITRRLTADGLEMTFATNHLAYFVLTQRLRRNMTVGGRIVNTASAAHLGARLDFDDMQSEKRYSTFGVYGRSKLCNILFTRELARRLKGTGITANCLHPGFVASRLGEGRGRMLNFIGRAAKMFALTPEQGAQTVIHLASSPEVAATTGEYFYKCRPIMPSDEAQSDANAQRLWEISEQLCGSDGDPHFWYPLRPALRCGDAGIRS